MIEIVLSIYGVVTLSNIVMQQIKDRISINNAIKKLKDNGWYCNEKYKLRLGSCIRRNCKINNNMDELDKYINEMVISFIPFAQLYNVLINIQYITGYKKNATCYTVLEEKCLNDHVIDGLKEEILIDGSGTINYTEYTNNNISNNSNNTDDINIEDESKINNIETYMETNKFKNHIINALISDLMYLKNQLLIFDTKLKTLEEEKNESAILEHKKMMSFYENKINETMENVKQEINTLDDNEKDMYKELIKKYLQ